MTPPKEDGPQHTCGTMGDACSQACAAWTPRQRGPPPVSADSFLAVVHQRDEARASLSVAREALELARRAWAKRGVSAGVVVLDEHDGGAQMMRDALKRSPQPSTVEPGETLTEAEFEKRYPRAKPTVEPAREECHVVYRNRAKCSLPSRHDGEHRGQGYSWANHCVPAAKPTAEEKADPPLHTCWRSLYDPPTKERDCDGCRAELEPTAEEKPATNLDLARGELGRLRAELEEAKKQLGIQDFCFAAVAAERDAARARAEAAEKSLETANGLLREIERGGFVHDYHPAARSDDLAARLRAHLSLKGAK